jgi:hypothetical protein
LASAGDYAFEPPGGTHTLDVRDDVQEMARLFQVTGPTDICPLVWFTPLIYKRESIDELHRAVQAGQTTCVTIVQHYIDRARAYNGVASLAGGVRFRRPRTERAMFLTLCSPLVLERVREFVPDLVSHHSRDADPTGFCQCLQPRGYVDAIAIIVIRLGDHVAKVDPHRKVMRLSSGVSALGSAIARCTSAAHRTASTTLENSASIPIGGL